eukprot:1143263-Pelagomonas_calceolata.AAC.5
MSQCIKRPPRTWASLSCSQAMKTSCMQAGACEENNQRVLAVHGLSCSGKGMGEGVVSYAPLRA